MLECLYVLAPDRIEEAARFVFLSGVSLPFWDELLTSLESINEKDRIEGAMMLERRPKKDGMYTPRAFRRAIDALRGN